MTYSRKEYRDLRDQFVALADKNGVPSNHAIHVFPDRSELDELKAGTPRLRTNDDVLKHIAKETRLKDVGNMYRLEDSQQAQQQKSLEHATRRAAHLATLSPQEQAAAEAKHAARLDKQMKANSRGPATVFGLGIARSLPVADGVTVITGNTQPASAATRPAAPAKSGVSVTSVYN